MKAIMCSIFDITTSTFRQPFYAMNDNDAKRAFKMILNSNDLMRQNPSDFELYNMGCWDDEMGIYRDQELKGNFVGCHRLFKGGEVFYEKGANGNTL